MTKSITRALTELKTLDKRIEKIQRDAVFVTWVRADEPGPRQVVTTNVYQQIIDLIEYRKRLKAAVLLSNSQTRVIVNGVKYFVAEAIERKNSIQYDKLLLNRMKSQLGDITRQVETHNQQVRQEVDSMLQQSLRNGQQSSAKDLMDISDTFTSARRADIVDPLKLAGKIKILDETISGFESEVDLVLSESNATTFIEIQG